ncbi:ankyrin repeat protein, partial [archaeon]
TPLYAAVIFGDIPTIQKLGAMGIDPNEQQGDTGYSPLHIGVIKNQVCMKE